jgi:hypothetical protein
MIGGSAALPLVASCFGLWAMCFSHEECHPDATLSRGPTLAHSTAVWVSWWL